MGEQSQIGQPGEHNQQTPSKQGEADVKRDLNPNPIPPAPVHSEINPAPIAPQNPAQEKQRPRQGWKEFNWWKERGELVAFLAAVIIMVITYHEWQDMRQEHMLDERAWLMVSDFSQMVSEKNDFVTFNIIAKNTGKTPAINVQSAMFWAKRLDLIPQRDERPNPQVNSWNIPPDGGNRAESPPVTTDMMQGVANGVPFYMYGTFWYDDIFKRHHWSQFCVRVERTSTALNMINFVTMTNHNSCDDAQANQSK